jgi:hypothetical protein
MIINKKVVINIIAIILAGVLAYIFVYSKIEYGEVFNALNGVNYYYLLLGITLMGVFILCEGLNILSTISLNGIESKWSHIKYASAGFFFSSVTPSSTGGQPMQLIMMRKDGYGTGISALALFLEGASFQIGSIVFGVTAAIYLMAMETDMPSGTALMFLIGLLANGVVLLIYILCAFKIELIKKLVGLIRLVLRFLGLTKSDKKEEEIDNKIEEYKRMGVYIKGNKQKLLKMITRSLIQLLAYNSITLIVCLSLGISVNPILIILIQSVVNVSVSMLPVPGTIGVNETVFTVILSQLLGGPMAGTVAILTRLINFYIPVLITGMITMANYRCVRLEHNIH